VYDATESYDASFYLGGGLLVAGALSLVALRLPCLQTCTCPSGGDDDVIIENIEEIPAIIQQTTPGVQPEYITIEEIPEGSTAVTGV
jgi:hypothetical protein